MAWEETLKVWTSMYVIWFSVLVGCCDLLHTVKHVKTLRNSQMDKTMCLVDPQKMSEPTDITWVQDTCHPSLHKSGRKRQKCERKRLNVWLLSVWRKLHFGCFCKYLQVREIFRDIPRYPSSRYLSDIFPISPQVFPSSDTSGQSVWLEPRYAQMLVRTGSSQ